MIENPVPAAPAIMQVAGFWRRVAAFAIDMCILGVAGFVLIAVFGDAFSRMGPWARLVGLGLTLVYFAVFEGYLSGGQSLGKRLMQLRVIQDDGAVLGAPVAMGRAAVWAIPYFMNNLMFPDLQANVVLMTAVGVLVFAIGGSAVYLFVFNRRSGKGLQDLVFHTRVMRADGSEHLLASKPVWRGHLVVPALLAVLALSLPLVLQQVQPMQARLQPMMQLQKRLVQIPGVYNAGVWENTTMKFGSSERGTTQLAIQVFTPSGTAVNKDALIQDAAALTLKQYPNVDGMDYLTIQVTSGVDIGIASFWRSQQKTLKPAQWRANG